MTTPVLLDVAAVEAARARLRDAIYQTPCPYSQTLSELTGARCYVKLENLQMTGSFKERGAANLLLQLDATERRRGVVAASAGNHGLAVAFHAARLGVPAAIVMPTYAPLIKVTSARRYGAEVVLHGANFDEAYERARAMSDERGAVFVHPFDDPRVVAGQGTLGLELLEQVDGLDAVLVPVGGGGLIAGVALAIKAHRPSVRVIGVQAAAVPAMQRSLQAGERVRVPAGATIADGIAVHQCGEVTFELVARLIDEMVTVDEEELANAVQLLLEIEKTVVEGAGAAPLAALLNRPLGLDNRRVALVLSGGNIDVTMLARIIERGLVKDGRLVRFRLRIADHAGALARLTAVLAAQLANIIEISHDRAYYGVNLGDSLVEVTLETRGPDHITDLVGALEAAGYRPERVT